MAPLAQRGAAELLGTFLLVVVAAGLVVVDDLFDGSVTHVPSWLKITLDNPPPDPSQ